MKIGPITGAGDPTLGWVRLFGWGIHWKDTSRHWLLFSERNGYTVPFLRAGTFHFRFLKR